MHRWLNTSNWPLRLMLKRYVRNGVQTLALQKHVANRNLWHSSQSAHTNVNRKQNDPYSVLPALEKGWYTKNKSDRYIYIKILYNKNSCDRFNLVIIVIFLWTITKLFFIGNNEIVGKKYTSLLIAYIPTTILRQTYYISDRQNVNLDTLQDWE